MRLRKIEKGLTKAFERPYFLDRDFSRPPVNFIEFFINFEVIEVFTRSAKEDMKTYDLNSLF